MKIKTVVLLALVLSLGSVTTKPQVEHAPTVAQCEADQRLWLSKLEDDRGVDDVKFHTLEAWQREMTDCKEVDPTNNNKYINVMSEAEAELSRREFDFIARHGLTEQFIAEDEKGKR
jgi:hypothetical protein